VADLFNDQEAPIPAPNLDEQIASVERELGMRRQVYPRRVADNKMTQAHADLEIRRMEAVLVTLRKVARVRATVEAVQL
jgi:hypothetical protein